jgi:hypothetical protein
MAKCRGQATSWWHRDTLPTLLARMQCDVCHIPHRIAGRWFLRGFSPTRAYCELTAEERCGEPDLPCTVCGGSLWRDKMFNAQSVAV